MLPRVSEKMKIRLSSNSEQEIRQVITAQVNEHERDELKRMLDITSAVGS